MTATPIAIDNDFFCKSEVLEIAKLVLQLLGTQRSESLVLPTLLPLLTLGRGKLFRAHREHASFLVGRAKQYKSLAEAPPEWIAKMLDVPEIDPGEAMLLAHVADTDSLLLATGDKRALCAVSKVPGLCAALCGKVITWRRPC